jgi:hypothetical protein
MMSGYEDLEPEQNGATEVLLLSKPRDPCRSEAASLHIANRLATNSRWSAFPPARRVEACSFRLNWHRASSSSRAPIACA